MYHFFDIHTHNTVPIPDVVSVVNIRAPLKSPVSDTLYSYGVHPFDAHFADDSWVDIDFEDKRLVAIGEVGLDFRFEETAKQQIYWFEKQLQFAVKYDLPVVVHCVRAIPQTLDLLKKHDVERFVFHGFNGSLKNFERLVYRGGYVSFGAGLLSSPFLQSVFAMADKGRVLFETDESSICIRDIYTKAIELAGDDVGFRVEENFKTLFRYE